jgi:hypothetical protein
MTGFAVFLYSRVGKQKIRLDFENVSFWFSSALSQKPLQFERSDGEAVSEL